MSDIHHPIEPLSVFVRREFLFNMEQNFGEWEPGQIIALSSYTGCLLTFQVLLDSGAIFSDLPLAAVSLKRTSIKNLIKDVYYSNCPHTDIAVCKLPLNEATIFLPDLGITKQASYILSIDWCKVNQQMHLLKDKEGNLWLHPNYRILWRTNALELPVYSKLRKTWSYLTS